MLRFMIQKLTHKKWMVLSLLIGNILLIAVAASIPMYKNASLQRMLTDEFQTYFEENNVNPGIMVLSASIQKQYGKSAFLKMRNYESEILKELGLTPAEKYPVTEYLFLNPSGAEPLFKRSDENSSRKLQFSALTDLEDHIEIVSGRMYSDQITEDGFIEVIVSTSCFSDQALLVGDEFSFKGIKDADGKPRKVRVVGVFQGITDEDGYWVTSSDYYHDDIFVPVSLFDSQFLDQSGKLYISGYFYVRYDTQKVAFEKSSFISEKLSRIVEDNDDLYTSIQADALQEILATYLDKQDRINTTLMILQVPVLVLICAFLFMISDQMLQMERNEISQLKSRGAGRLQILLIYLLQSLLLAGVSLVIGIPVGMVFCRAIGSSNAFLEFVSRRNLRISVDREVWIYCAAAFFVSVCMTVLPVIGYSKVTIVSLKRSKSRSGKPIWQKFFLDFLILGVSLYGYYSFYRQRDDLYAQVLSGASLDPLLFLSSSLFILGAGMVAVRLQPILVKLLYKLLGRILPPSEFASFLQTIRTGRRQYFIMIFLVLTVALGIFNATVARTIISNAERNIAYVNGVDVVLQEHWNDNSAQIRAGMAEKLAYTEPDFGRYESTEGIDKLTKVYHYEKVYSPSIKGMGVDANSIKVYGINTKEFGEMTDLENGLLPYQYRQYLNVLATNQNAVLVSSAFRDTVGLKLGDKLTLTGGIDGKTSTSFEIYGFVDYWPGYVPTDISVSENGTVNVTPNLMVIANFGALEERWGKVPYEVWIKLKDGVSADSVYDTIVEQKIDLDSFTDSTREMRNVRKDTLYQGTNGILTMSFIIILILCVVGFLIYWILSIRSRELLFGVFRAMGMAKNEILRMLIGEQLFSSVPAILLGVGVGWIASRLFVPLIQIAYASKNQILPLKILTENSDMMKLIVIIALMFLICMIILARTVFSMKISQALKLGED